jgi:pimeloyl-ACP methyl ester carboxylesterase
MTGYATVLGSRLEYAWRGDPAAAPAIVMLHDSLGSVGAWKDFPAELAQATGLSVLLYSREGFGRSDPLLTPRHRNYMHVEAETVLPALLAELDVKKPILFGHSDGATIAAICAGAHPDLPVGVILEAPHVFVEPITLAGIEKAKVVYRTTDLRRKLLRYHPDPDAVFANWTETWTAPYFSGWNVEEYIPQIRCPVLMIQGVDDEYGTAAQLETIAMGRADRSILLLENCGHSPHRDQPDAVLSAAKAFVTALLA